jgi:PAS domain S-box-containing protein
MIPVSQPYPDQPEERARLEQFFAWLNPVIVGLALLMLILFAVTSAEPLLPIIVLVLWFTSVLIWARRQARHGHLGQASIVISICLLIGGTIGLLLARAALPAVTLTPLLAVAIALPYLSATGLRRLIIAAWAVSILQSFLVSRVSIVSVRFLIDYLPLIAATESLAAVILLLLWQYRTRLTQSLEHTHATNIALREVQAGLEAEVVARTAEAREREARYRAIAELTSDFIYALQIPPGGYPQIAWATEAICNISGYSQAEMELLANWIKLIHPDDRLLYKEHARLTMAGQSDVCELRILTRSGDIRWLRNYTHPEWDRAQGRVVYILGAAQDITARKWAEDERLALERKLLEAQKLESLGVLAGGIAHDFNNLLMVVLGNAGLVLHDLPPESPLRKNVTQIEIAVQRASDLTRQMLAYTGRGDTIVERLDLNPLVEELSQLLNTTIAPTVTLDYQLAPCLPVIEADGAQIRQLLTALIVNASEAIGDTAGTIILKTGVRYADRAYLSATNVAADLPAGEYVYLEVADTGSGMDAATAAKIFDPFFTTKFTGRGLGLAAGLGIVRGHGGTIKVWSERGRGTTLTVLLPIPRDEDETMRNEDTARSPHSVTFSLPPSPGTVLVVDDEEAVRNVASRLLERAGFTILAADNGYTAVETFRAHADAIICVLMDMVMPRLNGEQAFHAIRAIKPDARVILMSGYDEQRVPSRLAGEGLAGFLQKPFTSDVLLEKIRQVLGESDLL